MNGEISICYKERKYFIYLLFEKNDQGADFSH